MKITLKSLISLCLSVLLLISTVACNSPVEPSTGNDSTVGMTEEQTTEEHTTEEQLSEEITTEERIANEDLYPLLNKNNDPTEFWQIYSSEQRFFLSYFYPYQAWSLEHGVPPTKDPYKFPGAVHWKWKEISTGVYTDKNTYEEVLEKCPDGAYILCEIQFKEIIEAYAVAKEAYLATAEEGAHGIHVRDLPGNLRPKYTWEECAQIVEQYRATLLDNGVIIYCENQPFYYWGLYCFMTKEQFLNFKLSEENLQNGQYVVVAPSDVAR
jgi:hypothetical protein